MTRRDRCTRIITTLARAGRDHEIHKALETVLAFARLVSFDRRGLEDLATQVVAGERVSPSTMLPWIGTSLQQCSLRCRSVPVGTALRPLLEPA
jgi:hypothetical protein